MAQTGSDVAQTALSGGNTKLPTRNRARSWCFTLNNYTEEEYDFIVAQWLKGFEGWYIVGKEVGENGTPHLQGYIEFKHQTAFSTIKKFLPRAHIEKAKGSRADNYKYCSKGKDFVCNFEPDGNKITLRDRIKSRLLETTYKDVIWRPWQKDILDLIARPADSRSVVWIWEPHGNIGKSFLCKYIKLTRRAIIADGKKDNVLNQLNGMLEAELEPEVVILDIPRHGKDYMNYGLIEQLKDGCLYSGKYEGGDCIIDNVHVLIFANFEPDESKFSDDRWNIIAL